MLVLDGLVIGIPRVLTFLIFQIIYQLLRLLLMVGRLEIG